MKKKQIIIFFSLLFFSLSINFVSAEGSFSELQSMIDSTNNEVNIEKDYSFNSSIDNKEVTIRKNNLTINGNNHIIDGKNLSSIFYVTGKNIKINNLTLINGKTNQIGGAIYIRYGELTINNVKLMNNTAKIDGGAIFVNKGDLISKNSNFENNKANKGSSIYLYSSNCKVENSTIKSENSNWSSIYTEVSKLSIYNSIFSNFSTKYAGAIYGESQAFHSNIIEIKNSIFENLYSNRTGGAIGVKNNNMLKVINSTFFNVSSLNNGGAIYSDYRGYESINCVIEISKSNFINCNSGFGGAIALLNNNLTITDSKFINNTVLYNGGAIYTSYGNIKIKRSYFISNKANLSNLEDYSYGGALYLDMTNGLIDICSFEDNIASLHGGAVCTYDASLKFINNNFKNNQAQNGSGIYSFFDKEIIFTDNNFNTDTISLNNTKYFNVLFSQGRTLELINNTMVLNNYPSSFDLREFGWVTSIKDQGQMGSCWAVSSVDALASAILKATNTTYKFSANNNQNLMLKFSEYGVDTATEGGYCYMGPSYLINWLGPIFAEKDPYDELGKISPYLINDFRVQDVVFIPKRENSLDNNKLKEALMKYGALSVNYYSTGHNSYYNDLTCSQYYNGNSQPNHAIVLVGWDDNYSKNNFNIKPPGDGAFILKNSWGEDWGDNGYLYVSYYDTQFATQTVSIAFNLNNTEKYTKNYQYDLSSFENYQKSSKTDYLYYSNHFKAVENDLIAAIGTFFQYKDNYEVYIYVNNELKYSQSGINSFLGYNTIKLNKYVQIKKGDKFEVKVKSRSMPYQMDSRVHIQANKSFISEFGIDWKDLYPSNKVACLKAYTIESTIIANDLIMYYNNGSKFSAKILDKNKNPLVNLSVDITLNNVSHRVLSDNEGNVYLDINQSPGKYNITVVNPNDGLELEYILIVLETILANNTSIYFGNESNFIGNVLDGQGKPLANKNITVSINNKIYIGKSDEEGNIYIKNDLKPGEYILSIINPNDGLIKNITINILETIISDNIIMYYNNGSKFIAELLDGFGNPLTNTNVKININDTEYSVLTDEEGKVYLNILEKPGNYIISLINPNNGLEKEYNLTVLETLSGSNLIMYYNNGSEFIGSLLDGKGNPLTNQSVNITINGTTYTCVSDNNGKVYLAISERPGDYIISIVNPNDGRLKEYNLTILTTLIVEDLTKYYNNNSNLDILVLDGHGNPANNSEVKIMINNVSYFYKTNEIGLAKVNIDLEPGNYNITIINSDGINKTIKINILTTLIANNLVKYCRNESQFIIYALDKEGNPANNIKILININGVNYKRVTNNYGKAIFNINLNPGNYTLNLKKLDDGLMKTYNVTVLSTIIAKDLVKYYRNNSQFYVHILDNNGNDAVSRKISININGVFYHRTTNDKGIARLNINLDPKNYIITSYYGDAVTSNKIKVN